MWLKFLAVVLPDSKSLMYRPLIAAVVPRQRHTLRLGFVVNARKILNINRVFEARISARNCSWNSGCLGVKFAGRSPCLPCRR